MDWATQKARRRPKRRGALLVAILGSVIASLGLWIAIAKTVELHRGALTRGTVVGHIDVSVRHGTQHIPRVAFRDRSGKQVTFTAWDSDGYEQGSVVQIVYDPQRARWASIYSPFENWKAPIVLRFFATVLLWPSIHRLRSARSFG